MKPHDSPSAKPRLVQGKLLVPLLILALAFLFSMICYGENFGRYPLLDEQYLLGFFKSTLSNTSTFLPTIVNWSGPQNEDSWGVLSTTLGSLSCYFPKTALWSVRLLAILIHAGNALLFFLVARHALEEGSALVLRQRIAWLAGASALLFVSYPLAPETVSYLGGFAYQTGCLLMLASFLLYFKGRNERNWTYLGLSWIAFVLCMLCDSSLWSAGALMFILELARAYIGHEEHDGQVENKGSSPAASDVFADKVDLLLEHERQSAEVRDEHSGGAGGAHAKDASTGARPEHHKHEEGPGVLLDSFVPSLVFVFLGALIPIGALPAANNEKLASHFIANSQDWMRVLKHLFLPVNAEVFHNYNAQYRSLYVLFAIPAVMALIALIRSRHFRQNFVFLGLWLLVVVVPHLHHMLSDETLSGSRWAYNAILPVTGLIALLFFSPAYALHDWRLKGADWLQSSWFKLAITIACCALFLILMIGDIGRTHKQNRAYKNSANWLKTIQSNALNVARKEKTAFALVRNLPASISITPFVSPFNLVLIDGDTTLVRAYKVPGGQLKDCLRDRKYRDVVVRWQEEFNSLIPAVSSLSPEVPRESKVDARGLINKLRPGLYFLKGASFDEKENCLVFNSNGNNGPVVNFEFYGVDTTGDDFFYVDARVDTPQNDENAHMEMYWLTNLEQEHKKQNITDRHILARVKVNDGQFHRYYLPLRSTGWTTNGQIVTLTLGFPASAKVQIKEIGTQSPPNRLPKFTTVGAHLTYKPPFYFQECYNYPDLSEFGLTSIDRAHGASFRYDASMVEGCDHALMEVSMPNQFFNNPNGDELSRNTYKRVFLDKPSGIYNLSPYDLKLYDGVYSLRVFAVDKAGKILANGSDEINCLVYTNGKDSD